MFHGRGVLIGADGDRYEGEFKEGMRHGKGVMKKTGIGLTYMLFVALKMIYSKR